LVHELDHSRIKSRSKGHVDLLYLEGFDIIETANKIFGYGNWGYTISELGHVSKEVNSNKNHVIGYKSVVKVVVQNIEHLKYVVREDVGFGCGIAKTLAEAHENAAKEAVTDAIKRAMRSFGNQFGNSLYNRNHKHHNQTKETYKAIHLSKQDNNYTSNQIENGKNFMNYSNLHELGLSIVKQGSNLVVTGNDIFSKKDKIKAHGFRWNADSKVWYKPINTNAA
jgi:DNA repair and recombination protein RAD52